MKTLFDIEKAKAKLKNTIDGQKAEIKSLRFDKATFKKIFPVLIEGLLFAFIIAFDLLMKDYLLNFLKDKSGLTYDALPKFMALTYSENPAAGFGRFNIGIPALSTITGIVVSVILLYLLLIHNRGLALRLPLVMIAAGGIGNLVDRVQLGYVRDFFEFTFMDFAIFNVADAFVTVGAFWLVIYLIVEIVLDYKKDKRQKEEKDSNPPISCCNSVESQENDDDGDAVNADIEANDTANQEIAPVDNDGIAIESNADDVPDSNGEIIENAE